MSGEIIFYQSDDGTIRLETRLENETLWLTQQQMAELFQTTVPNISMHVKNVFDEGELQSGATVQDFLTVRQEGGRQVQRKLTHYNLDMVISVGYRVKSLIANRFRIWATQQLKEYIVKGFVMDDERLKNPTVSGSAVPSFRRKPESSHKKYAAQQAKPLSHLCGNLLTSGYRLSPV